MDQTLYDIFMLITPVFIQLKVSYLCTTCNSVSYASLKFMNADVCIYTIFHTTFKINVKSFLQLSVYYLYSFDMTST